MSILRKFILDEIKRSFNLSVEGSNSVIIPKFEDLNVWCYHGIVTQDIDDIHEFIYKLKITLDHKLVMNYFLPQGKLAYFFLPKIKIHWVEKIQQIQIGTDVYNIIKDFNWQPQYDMFELGNSDMKMKMKCKNFQYKTVDAILVPCKLYSNTIIDEDPPKVKIMKKKMQYEYRYLHFDFIMNRQGIYVNRKHRDKLDIVEVLDTSKYVIVEPAEIIIEDKHNNTIVVKL